MSYEALETRTLVWPDGSEVTFAGEELQMMEDEAAYRGLTLTQLWDTMLREFRDATDRELESS